LPDQPHVVAEIASQPDCWRRAAAAVDEHVASLPGPGERVAVAGCGTSYFAALTYAALRERAGHGSTDAFPASEFPTGRIDGGSGRVYDRVVVISRSGTTTEILELLDGLRGHVPTVALTASGDAPIGAAADVTIELDFADEQAVVQTRFVTTVLALLRAALGHDVEALAADGERALAAPLDGLDAEQVTFLGRGWTVGLAHEAALKLREAAGAWAESYPAMEYRHGPISIAEPGRVVWMFGEPPNGLAGDVERTGAVFVHSDGTDPLAHLLLAQRLAVALAVRRGLDPDRPRNLARSVIIDTA
jgi:fructoselysine-6-P-deglycase FrlB-like protein